MSQQNPSVYAAAIQAQLASIVTPVPVYANFNRNWSTQPKFLTWQLRNIHQPVYTGSTQNIKGIDRPTFQISVFATTMGDAFTLSNSILQSLHGYSGAFGTSSFAWLNNSGSAITWLNNSGLPISWISNAITGLLYVSKADVIWLYNTYDNDTNLHQIILDCTIDVPT
jgi:hypothetical protein